MCSFALFINYFVDRFSLMRTWKRAPQLGSNISKFSRQYFFSLAFVAMAFMSSYYWASFPYDNLCVVETTDQLNSSIVGSWTLAPYEDNRLVDVTITPETEVYKPCLQDFFRFPKKEQAFPFIPKFQREGEEWMNDTQEDVTNIFGWTAVGVIGFVLLRFFYNWYNGFMGLFRGTFQTCGDDQGIHFSEVPSISSYVPQIESSVFSYPLLAANIDKIDSELLDWNDPDRPHAFYDLTKDAEIMLRGMDISSKVVFSQIAHWPPPNKKKDT